MLIKETNLNLETVVIRMWNIFVTIQAHITCLFLLAAKTEVE